MAKTKFFRIAVEGATTDGREISADWINQMAASYNPATYTARINCEHLRGYSPDAPFNAYGSVLSLKADDVDLAIDGKTEKRRALFAELDANDQLVEINKKGQKLYTSCEVNPKFAGTDKAYLVGLAVTDSPASLGTEILKFAAGQGDANPFAARKLDKGNLFTAAAEAAIEVVAAPTDDATKTLFAAATDFFKNFGKAPAAEPEKPKETPPANDNDARFAAMGEGMTALSTAMQTALGVITGKVDSISTEFGALKSDLASQEAPRTPRKPATGGDVSKFTATDC